MTNPGYYIQSTTVEYLHSKYSDSIEEIKHLMREPQEVTTWEIP